MRDQRGQATLELALCLPFVVLLIGCVVGAGLVASDHARVWHAAREAARVAAVDPSFDAIRMAAEHSGLHGLSIAVQPAEHERVAGEPATVTATYTPRVPVPLIGALFERMKLSARAAMAIEVP